MAGDEHLPAALPAALVETHISIVFFVGDRAYKLKKPVDFAFADQRTRQARQALCHREVELNRRLAPDVYLGVTDLVGPDGEPTDHLVTMRRMPADRRLSVLVEAGDEGLPAVIDELGRLLARFHRTAERSAAIDAVSSVEAVTSLWHDNFTEIRPSVGEVIDEETFGEAVRLADEFLAGRGPLFARRQSERAICDGHGDLQTDDVFCLDDGPRVLDCIEFNDAFRFGDVANDIAFLVMDLERLGAPALADQLVAAYEDEAGAQLPPSLLRFFVAYRAQVRAKVACLRAEQFPAGDLRAAEAQTLAAQHLDRCVESLRAAVPRLVLVGGLPGSGKSTLARGLGEALGATVVRSDLVRKEGAGLDPSTSAPDGFGQGLYSPSVTEAVYAELLDRAATDLSLGRSVVLDASFTSDAHRVLARCLAEESHSALVEILCEVPADVAVARIERRRAKGLDASDADPAVAAAMAAGADPWPEARSVSTVDEKAVVLARVLTDLAQMPYGRAS